MLMSEKGTFLDIKVKANTTSSQMLNW